MTIQRLQLKPGETCEGKTQFPISECPNMKSKAGDRHMSFEHYECAVCGKRDKLDYDEMR
jgi:hypothetical protein